MAPLSEFGTTIILTAAHRRDHIFAATQRGKGSNMSLDGVWKIEMLGVYGWEAWATAFLEDGLYRAGGADHYATGTFVQHDDSVMVSTEMVVYDPHRTMFGKRDSEYQVRFEGRHANDTIDGHAKDADGSLLVRFRASKVADLA